MKKILFVEMMGEPGSYDASVYDHFEDKDKEGVWFVKRFSDPNHFSLSTCNVCIDEELPHPNTLDGVVLAGSYNSVHDNTFWQQNMRAWLPEVMSHKIPTLGVCGSHQLMSHLLGASVEKLKEGPYAGTFSVELTEAGRASPLMRDIDNNAGFQFANSEHVTHVPNNCTLLASSGRVPVAALDFGNHCYSTQYHPEGTHETLSTVWRYEAPELMENYWPENNGFKLLKNFFNIVKSA